MLVSLIETKRDQVREGERQKEEAGEKASEIKIEKRFDLVTKQPTLVNSASQLYLHYWLCNNPALYLDEVWFVFSDALEQGEGMVCVPMSKGQIGIGNGNSEAMRYKDLVYVDHPRPNSKLVSKSRIMDHFMLKPVNDGNIS